MKVKVRRLSGASTTVSKTASLSLATSDPGRSALRVQEASVAVAGTRSVVRIDVG